MNLNIYSWTIYEVFIYYIVSTFKPQYIIFQTHNLLKLLSCPSRFVLFYNQYTTSLLKTKNSIFGKWSFVFSLVYIIIDQKLLVVKFLNLIVQINLQDTLMFASFFRKHRITKIKAFIIYVAISKIWLHKLYHIEVFGLNWNLISLIGTYNLTKIVHLAQWCYSFTKTYFIIF